jgi:hypothetical protein
MTVLTTPTHTAAATAPQHQHQVKVAIDANGQSRIFQRLATNHERKVDMMLSMKITYFLTNTSLDTLNQMIYLFS